MGLCFLWFYVQELPKAQPAVVLILKRLRRRGNGLKSHPTDWEKPGIEPATPGLQDIGLSPYTTAASYWVRVYTNNAGCQTCTRINRGYIVFDNFHFYVSVVFLIFQI